MTMQMSKYQSINGKISKINYDLRYGFINSNKTQDIFFNEDSICQENRVLFSDLAVDQRVNVDVKETERGLLATRVKKI